MTRDGRLVAFPGGTEGGKFIFLRWSYRFYGHEDCTWLVGMFVTIVDRVSRIKL